MRKLLLAAAVLSFTVACHNRNQDEVGAAPDQATTDTAATTHVIDSTRTGPPGMGGRPGNATVTSDSVGVDSANQPMQHDSTTMQHDSTMMRHDSTMMMQHDSTMMMQHDSTRTDSGTAR